MSTLNIDNDYIHLNSASSDKVVVEGNLGIGTTSPTQKLTIGQSGESINYIRIIATTADFYMGANATGPHLGVTNGAKILQTNSYPLVIGTTANQELYLGANNATIATLVDGKFGIGTTSPLTKFNVYVPNGTNDSFLIHSPAGNTIVLGGLSTGLTYLRSYEGSFEIGNSFPGGDLRLKAGNAERMRITSAGNVGIGTASPSAKLDVVGNGRFYSAIGATDDVRTGIAHYDTTAQASNVGG